jgi:hypothetical protein
MISTPRSLLKVLNIGSIAYLATSLWIENCGVPIFRLAATPSVNNPLFSFGTITKCRSTCYFPQLIRYDYEEETVFIRPNHHQYLFVADTVRKSPQISGKTVFCDCRALTTIVDFFAGPDLPVACSAWQCRNLSSLLTERSSKSSHLIQEPYELLLCNSTT